MSDADGASSRTRPTREDLESLPKIELHVHLEGSTRAETAIALAEKHGEDPATVLPLEDGAYPVRFGDFGQFVALYIAVSQLIRTPDDLSEVCAAFVRQQAAQNVRYTEATFTAATFVALGWEPAAVWAAVRDGFAACGPQTEVRLIIDAVRDVGPVSAERTIALVREADAPIAGFGLAGDERGVSTLEFPMLRGWADRLGIGLAVHAGETGPAGNITDALTIGADRIGHGVAAANDADVLARLVRDGVPLEVCPTSNVVLGVAASHDEHPLPALWAAGANVTINSDDPPFFGTTLTDELAHAVRLLDLTHADVALLQRRAIDAAFTTTTRRQELHREVDAWVAATA